MDSSTHNLLFLLASAPMIIGGCKGDDGDSSTVNTTNPDETETGGNQGDGDGDGDGTPGDGDGTPGDGDGTPGDGDGTPGDGDGDGDYDCGEIAQHWVECLGVPYYNAYEVCQEALFEAQEIGPACFEAYADMWACVSALSCEEWAMGTFCLEEEAVWEEACDF